MFNQNNYTFFANTIQLSQDTQDKGKILKNQPHSLRYVNQPNPFRDKTMIGFYLPGGSEVQLVLTDETGSVLKTIKQDGTTGYNVIQLEIEDLTTSFIINCQPNLARESRKCYN